MEFPAFSDVRLTLPTQPPPTYGIVEHDKMQPGRGYHLNFDVLLLIATYAHPRDLLGLACTCKHFREVLMDEASTPVWNTARRKFGLPDCPADLTEQEYADLAFRPRCHSCGEYASTVFWEIRRRYCPDCRLERLCHLPSCPEIIQRKYVLGMEHLTIGIETPLWVDREQMDSLMEDYNRSSAKQQLLRNRQEQLVAVRRHARQCENWQKDPESDYKFEQGLLIKERDKRIFKRLNRHGFKPEIEFFGHQAIRESRRSLFATSQPLTDKEWDRIWPEWLERMNDFRLERLERTVFRSRRLSLVHEYNTYVTCPSPDTPSFDLLPHVADMACFPPFRDIITAPEGTQMDDKLFDSAFAQLPELIDEWRRKLDAKFAELIAIPSDLSSNDSQVRASTSTTRSKPSQSPTEKLKLAAAQFCTANGSDPKGTLPYPDVLSTSMHLYRFPADDETDSKHTWSIWKQFDIAYAHEAPYIVHACGLDPNVATVEEMDCRNPRLTCLSCWYSSMTGFTWRQAVWHASSRHRHGKPQWRLVGHSGMDKNEAPKLAEARGASPTTSRCLLCMPRVGDASKHKETISHLVQHHGIEETDIKWQVHYQPLITKD